MPPELDVNALATQIGQEMFPPPPPEDNKVPTDPAGTPPPPPPPPPDPTGAPPPPIDPLVQLGPVMPRTWKKEMEAHWSKTPKEVQEYAIHREADVSRGMQMYSDSHKNWTALLQPYQEVLAKYPNVNPVQLLSSLMNAHLTMTFGNAEQKVALFRKLQQDYKVSLDGTPPQQAAIPPEFTQRMDFLENSFRTMASSSQEKLVNEFFSDPKNEYANEVAPDIVRLLKGGAAADLPSAYEMAIWQNPAVRAKLIKKQVDEDAKKAEKAEAERVRRARLNINGADSSSGTPPGTKGKSINDTVDLVAAKFKDAPF